MRTDGGDPAARRVEVAAGPGGRLVGIDVARSLALAGMFAAHIGDVPDLVDWGDPASWTAAVNGRASTLFAVLAGVSIALMTGRDRPVPPEGVWSARGRLAIRAVVIVAIGLLLMAFGTPVAIILPTYGVLFVVVLPALRWRRRGLLLAAALCVLASVPAAIVTAVLYAGADSFTAQLGLIYPLVTFLGFVLVGMAVGRTPLVRRRVRWALLLGGAALATAAYAIGERFAPIDPTVWRSPGVPTPGNARTPGQALAQEFLSPRDHSSSIVDMLGTVGIAVAVIGLCSLLFDGDGVVARAVALPLAAVGSMPLSVYSIHILAIAVLQARQQGIDEGAGIVWLFILGAVVFAVAWRRLLGRGPLERLLAALTRPSAGP